MTRLLLALLLCAACKHSTSSSSTSHTETSTVTDATSTESGATTTVTTQTEGPSETTVTTEEFAPPDDPPVAAGTGPVGPGSPAVAESQASPHGTATVPRQGPLVKRTVTVTKSGQETTQTRQEASTQAQGATETKRNTEGDKKTKGNNASAPSGGCIGASWMIGLGILLFAVALILGILKFRKPV